MNKLTKSFFGIALGTAMVFGIGAAVLVNNNNEVKEAEAATNGRFTILIDDDSWWKDNYAQIWATYSSAGQVRITPDPDLGTVENDGFTWHDFGDAGWYAVLTMEVDIETFTYGNFYFQRKNPSDGGDWGNSGWVLSPSKVADGTCNTVRIASDNSFKQDWGNYWKMTTYSGQLDYASVSGATKAAYLKSSGYGFVAENPTAPSGYEFAGWYTDKSFTKQWTSSSRMSADTTLYAKYNQVTAKLDDNTDMTWNSSNSQFETIKYFDANATFHVVKTVGGSSTNYAALDSYMSPSVATSDGTNVTVKAAGTYAIYFKSNNTIWLQIAEASQIAYMYAGYFLTNVGCDATGATPPSGWTNVKNRYESAAVNDAAKDYIYNFDTSKAEEGDDIVAMFARYQIAIAQHPSLNNFLKNSSGTPIFASHRITTGLSVTENSNAMLIVTIIASIGILTAGAYLFFKKSKKVED